MASRICVEERRHTLTRRVLEIAAIATSSEDFLHLLEAALGTEPIRLGSGCSRTAYEIPEGLVVKIVHYHTCDHNKVEWAAYQKRPDLVVPLYGSFSNDCIDVLIARKARIYEGRKYQKGSRHRRSADKIMCMFNDAHFGNIGFIGNRLYITDVGHGFTS